MAQRCCPLDHLLRKQSPSPSLRNRENPDIRKRPKPAFSFIVTLYEARGSLDLIRESILATSNEWIPDQVRDDEGLEPPKLQYCEIAMPGRYPELGT